MARGETHVVNKSRSASGTSLAATSFYLKSEPGVTEGSEGNMGLCNKEVLSIHSKCAFPSVLYHKIKIVLLAQKICEINEILLLIELIRFECDKTWKMQYHKHKGLIWLKTSERVYIPWKVEWK